MANGKAKCAECQEKQATINNLTDQIALDGRNDEIADALGKWFEKRDVPYEKMDADTAWLWKVYQGV